MLTMFPYWRERRVGQRAVVVLDNLAVVREISLVKTFSFYIMLITVVSGKRGEFMRFVIWRMVIAVFIVMLALVTVGNGISAVRGSVSVRAPISRAVFAPVGTVVSPAGFALASKGLSDPSWVMPDLTGGGLTRRKGKF